MRNDVLNAFLLLAASSGFAQLTAPTSYSALSDTRKSCACFLLRMIGATRKSACAVSPWRVQLRKSNPTQMGLVDDDIYPFPDRVLGVIAKRVALDDCSFVDLPEDLGRRILDSELFRESTVQPLSKFEISEKRSSAKQAPAPVEALSLLGSLHSYFEPQTSFSDWLESADEEQDLKTDLDFTLRPGLGLYEIQWEGESLFILSYERQQRNVRGVAVFVNGKGRQSHLSAFCNLDDFKPKLAQKKVDVFVGRVNPNTGDFSWERSEQTHGRSLETVLLPETIKGSLENDLESFLTAGRLASFRKHGIPYKRSYLLYGVPGSGKTSTIRALATKFDRRLCILQPSGSAWNDYLLNKAVQSAPARAMIVFEDSDTLFSEARENIAQSGVTFSGLLNVLDGVNCKDGTVFVLTTNHRDRLDEALTREGRIDMEVQFNYIQPAEVVGMFSQFYPEEEDTSKATQFEAALKSKLGKKQYESLSPAALQLYLVKQLGNSADDAIQNVGIIAKPLKPTKRARRTTSAKTETAEEPVKPAKRTPANITP